MANGGHSYRSAYGDFYSRDPAAAIFSSDGNMLAQQNFFKAGYQSQLSYFFETDDDKLVVVGEYNPERDTLHFNYDPEIKDAILFFYKLDYDLNKLDSVEYHIAIDTAVPHSSFSFLPLQFSGLIWLFSVIEDEGNIVGTYSKRTTRVNPGGTGIGNDTLFFFRMNYEGEIIHENFIEMNGGASPGPYNAYRHQLVSTDEGYILYYSGTPLSLKDGDRANGQIMYLDKDFNLVHFRWLFPGSGGNNAGDITVKRTSRNTTFLSGRTSPYGSHDKVRIMEINDDDYCYFSVNRSVIKGVESWDNFPAVNRSVDFVNDEEIFWAYGLEYGFNANHDSYIIIEKMDGELNTINEVYYDIDDYPTETWAGAIVATQDGGVLLVGDSQSLASPSILTCFVVKFPAEAFLSVEEAHNNNLHTAIAFPNPGHDVLNIKTALQNASVEVYDVSGEVVYRQDISENITSVFAETWPSGMYLWKVYSDGNEAESGKWVKE